MVGDNERVIHSAPRRMVAGLVVAGAVLVTQAVLSLIQTSTLLSMVHSPPWLEWLVDNFFYPALNLAALVGALLVARGLDRSIPGGEGWLWYRIMYVCTSLGVEMCGVVINVWQHMLLMPSGVPRTSDISLMVKLSAAGYAVETCGDLVVLMLTLRTLMPLYRGSRMGRWMPVLAGGILLAQGVAGVAYGIAFGSGWSDSMAPLRILQQMGWWSRWGMPLLQGVANATLGGLVLGVIAVVRARLEGRGFAVEGAAHGSA